MQGDLTADQFEKVLQLCSILGLEDFALATSLLKESNWSLQHAIGLQQNHPAAQSIPENPLPNPNFNPNPVVVQPQEYHDANFDNLDEVPIDYNMNQNQNQANEYEYEYDYYQKQFDRMERLQNNKKTFDQGFESIPLVKTKSQVGGDGIQSRISEEKEMEEENKGYRFQYESKLLDKTNVLCQRLLGSKSPQLKRYYESVKKNQNNRQFLAYLHKKYKTGINFTFGTFLSNLARAHLDKKYLLVYIHRSELEDNKSVSMILQQKQIANFVNKNCVCYGMFDSSDDYQLVYSYLPMKNLPAFALFKLNKKQLKEQFVSQYPILQSGPESFLQWLAPNIGVSIKKKEKKVEQSKISKESQSNRIEMSNIIYEQNFEYEEMARLYQMKRNKSKLRKQSLQTYEQELEKMREQFKNEPALQPGKSIQIRFRLPMSGNSLLRVFQLDDTVGCMFDYVHCFGRDEFEEKLANFDLTQTFPKLSLEDKKSMLISEVFAESERENIIVKEL